ncbi:Uncharacterized protein HZ326_27261 [Fusarium oxysporum f. sp. albedinis]|nr:Uncharacterized protein HZ326_27261 [Fusarium oxysporum f. sp. albedinis]
MGSVMKEWIEWYSNRQFAAYLSKLVKGLGEVPVDGIITEPPSASPDFQLTSRSPGFVSIDDLFHHVPPSPTLVSDSLLEGLHRATWTNPGATARLPAVLVFLDRKAKLYYEHHYLPELRQSLASLKGHAGHELNRDRVSMCADLFQKHLKQCKGRVESIYRSLLDAVNQDLEDLPGAIQRIVEDTGFRPRISPIFFLQQLRSSRWPQLPSAWQDAIIEYGQVITALQQAKRLIQFQNDHVDLLRELESTGHKNWNPREHPEWLLLECESEILIRDVQQQIAQQMIQPPDNKNSVMQLNMGEGKSSVIVPSVAAVLGDGSKLIRVIVAKPQAKQLHQMLTSKLSGLLDRPVYQLPFSMDIRMNESRAEAIHQLISECMQEGGVLLVQPEHLLSFQLMELECQLDNKPSVAEKMMEVRKFFDTSSRDVVDESDENFSVNDIYRNRWIMTINTMAEFPRSGFFVLMQTRQFSTAWQLSYARQEWMGSLSHINIQPSGTQSVATLLSGTCQVRRSRQLRKAPSGTKAPSTTSCFFEDSLRLEYFLLYLPRNGGGSTMVSIQTGRKRPSLRYHSGPRITRRLDQSLAILTL